VVASVLKPEEFEAVRQRLAAQPEPPGRASLTGQDWLGALGVFLLVFLSTFPVVIPFLCMEKVGVAMRVSNLIAVAMLFLAGAAYARCIGRHPFFMGVAMVVLGLVLVAITMALGG